MTQALLNNLNIKQDSGRSGNDINAMSSNTNFAQILSKATSKTKQNKETENNKNQESNSNNTSTETDSRENINKDMEGSVLTESTTATVIDISIVKEDLLDTNETSNEAENIATENDESIANEQILIQEDTTEPNITEEEPTMNKELITLEDSTMSVLMHSQLQNALTKVTDDDSQINQSENETIKFKDTGLKNDTVIKTFENLSSKDAATLVENPKENYKVKQEDSKIQKVISEELAKELNIEAVNTESSQSNDSTDLMQNQSPQEQAAKVLIQGEIKYDKVAAEAVKTTQVKPTEISPSKIIEQISKQLEGMHNSSKLNIVLNPGSLGKVNLHILNSKDGLIAQFTVTSQDTKDLLMKGLDGLKESLLAQGVNVNNVSIKLEEFDSEYNPDWTEQEGSRGGNKEQESKKQKENEKSFEELIGIYESKDGTES